MRWRRRAGFTAAALVLLAACGDDGETEDPISNDSPGTTEEEVDEEAAVLDAYLAGWDAFGEASNPADPAHPALDETMTGSHLESVRTELSAMSEKGEYIEADPDRPREHSAQVTSLVRDERAEITDCSVGWAQRYAEDGSVVQSAEDPTPHEYAAVMAFEDGTWKTSELNQGEACEL